VEQGDVLEGSAAVRFDPGQRQANVHIAFVPPFAAVPAVECAVSGGRSVRLKIASVQTFGIRIEAKRTGDCEFADTAEIGFTAVAPVGQANAA
jgi:hypothetical protein